MRTCFLIENDEEDQEIFSLALQEVAPGSNLVVAENGVSALALLQADRALLPSMIFIDMNMPLMNGKECLQELKKIGYLREVPVYIYSTTADPAAIAEVKALGAEDFFEKPSSYHQFTVLLAKLIAGYRLRSHRSCNV
ncbi:response regulator [Paraflavisolibacter sp. H34]|uniref:response regulator n=1 Tax=Huijunlia imazamoxiresistens TaxID=3127457 RepID=UPI0030193BA9